MYRREENEWLQEEAEKTKLECVSLQVMFCIAWPLKLPCLCTCTCTYYALTLFFSSVYIYVHVHVHLFIMVENVQ